jgi:hypothetical protein
VSASPPVASTPVASPPAKRPPVATRHRATPLRNGPQRLLHLLVVAAGWGLFAWGWHKVSGQPWDTEALVILIAGSAILLPTLTVLWILHNLRIHRQKGPRTRSRPANDTYRHDWNGREVDAYWPAMSAAQIVVIDIVDGRKSYRAGGPRTTPAPGERRRSPAAGPRAGAVVSLSRPDASPLGNRERVA